MAGARLSLAERAQIEVLFGQGLTFPAIGRVIGRDRTTVWREVSRNNAYRGAHLLSAPTRSPAGRGPRGRGGAYRCEPPRVQWRLGSLVSSVVDAVI